RLEALRNLWEMSAADYREAWLWVHFCLHRSEQTQRAFYDHLTCLRRGQPDSLAERLVRLEPNLNQAVELHLAQLADAVGNPADLQAGDNFYQPTHSLWQTSWNATRQLLRPLRLTE